MRRTAPDLGPHRRTFAHLLANTLVASVTNMTVWFALTFWVYLETRSVFATGIISGIYLAFTALSGIWFGSLVDHHGKRPVMIGSGAASLALYGVALVIYLTSGEEAFRDPASVHLWVFVLVLMTGVIAGNIRAIAMTTAVTLLIPADRRDRANGLVGTTTGVSFLTTSVISGLLVGLAGMGAAVIVAIVVMALSVAHLVPLTVPGDGATSEADGPRTVDLRGTLAVVRSVPGLPALIVFSALNNLLGGVMMALVDAYGLSLVSVQTWGLLWGFLSTGFIVGGLVVARRGLGSNPVRVVLVTNVALWTLFAVFSLRSSIVLLTVAFFLCLCLTPLVEAAEQTVLQKVVPYERQGRVFGFAQSVEMSAAPMTAFLISPVAQFVAIPFMTDGKGADWIGSWFGTGADRGMALVFVLTGLLGLLLTLVALRTPWYRMLTERYQQTPDEPLPADAPAVGAATTGDAAPAGVSAVEDGMAAGAEAGVRAPR
jgi:MFS transporter, DHA3 family, multidrug efflux protein